MSALRREKPYFPGLSPFDSTASSQASSSQTQFPEQLASCPMVSQDESGTPTPMNENPRRQEQNLSCVCQLSGTSNTAP